MTTAIITGASRGLGFALASELANAGWRLIIDGRDADALRSAAATLAADVTAIPGDITDPAHRVALIEAAHGRLDLLVNNAGTLGPTPLPPTADADLAAVRDTFETNTIAPLALTQLALPLLRASHGIVADITSDAAVEGYPGWGAYGASKAATEQLRNVLAAEEPDVTVWRIDPGDLRTRMHQDAFPGEDISDRPLPESVAPAFATLLAARPPSGRIRLADVGTTTDDAADPGPLRLWLAATVDAYPEVAAFYRDALGLAEVDGWPSGAVFGVGATGRIEIARADAVDPAAGAVAALEFRDASALASARGRLVATGTDAKPITAHHRGHIGFTVTDPAGTSLYLWSER
jgi:NAD(P)-dependent dehydrogenase (short-subunit alcohol dehydrogenase family)